MADANSALAGRLEALHARGDFGALIEEGRRNRAGVAASAGASLFFGLACASTGAFSDAAAALARALELRPGDVAIKGALARVLILAGATEDAEKMIRELAAAANRDAAAAAALADTYLQAGRAEEAFNALAAAMRRFDHPSLETRLAETAIRTRRIEAGIAAARRAEARLGIHPAVLNVAGPAALLAGDESWLAREIALIDRAPAAISASVFDFWTGMLMAGDFLGPSRRAAELAAARAPSPLRWRLVSDLRLATRDIPGAEEAARAALTLDPRDANALSLLARCRILSGEIGEARRILLEAVALDPENAAAFDNLTQIDAAAMTPEMARRLEERLASGAFAPDVRAKALLALARRNEAEGEHKRAFERIIAAKGIIADAARAGGRAYRPEASDAAAQSMMRRFPEAIRAPDSGKHPPQFIFVVGMPRSGTSLVEQILASHPDVYGAGELPGMIEIWREFDRAPGEVARVVAENSDRWIERYRAGLPAASAGARFIVDKHPLNFWGIGLIRALFPEARIVNLKRPAVDVCLSILRVRFFGEYDFVNEIDAVAHYYAAYERMMTHWRSIFGAAVFDVDYERLVAEPESETRALLDFCGLSWNGACLSPHETKRTVLTHSAAQVREPINTRGVERRRKYGDSLLPLEEALARFGVQAR